MGKHGSYLQGYFCLGRSVSKWSHKVITDGSGGMCRGEPEVRDAMSARKTWEVFSEESGVLVIVLEIEGVLLDQEWVHARRKKWHLRRPERAQRAQEM